MKSKIIFILALAAMLVLTTGSVWADTINVPGNFLTIQAAIGAAHQYDTIMVGTGTYGPFTVEGKADITIQSNGVVTVQGVQVVVTAYSNRDCVVFVKDSTNIVLDGLDIEGNGLGTINAKSYGVIYEDSSGKIEDCTVSPNTIGDLDSVAIGVWDSSDLTVDTCTIENFGRIGVFYFNDCTGRVYDSTIIGQVYSGVGDVNYGIEVEGLYGACNIEIIGNVIYNCDNTYSSGPTWTSAAMLIDGWTSSVGPPTMESSTLRIEQNDIHDNYIGIDVGANSLSHAHYNNIHNNREYGVYSAPDLFGNYVSFDALYNWWGDVSGPYHPTFWGPNGAQIGPNLEGMGDDVSNYVLYDPWIGQGGFVTGGGTFLSAEGDYAWNREAAGEANFGFVAKYKKGANVPEGHTNFVFDAGNLHFSSSEYDWLVVAGTMAQFKGKGTIEGESGLYKFKLWAKDDDPDTFRIKIWEEIDSVEVVYDNGGDPLTGGNIFIHKEKKK